MAENLITCPICDLLQEKADLNFGDSAQCSRCHTTLYHARKTSTAATLAYSFAALIMLVPANIYPIMTITRLGRGNAATLLESIEVLYEEGSFVIASLIFFASVFTPIIKLIGLFYLALTAKSVKAQKRRTELYEILEYIGRWSMIDVFLVAILVGVVKLEEIANVTIGPGSIAFSAVVVLTILAAKSFDPRIIWQDEGQESELIYEHKQQV